MVILRNVSKRYGHTTAVNSLSMEIPHGQVVGLLGENGAGKTTLMNMLSGYFPASSGDIVINGADMLTDPASARGSIGYMPEQVPLYPELTVTEYLVYCCALKQVSPKARETVAEEAAATAGIAHVMHQRIGTVSKGMKQRVGLAQALCGNPPLLLLDEPTAGFDPAQAAEFRGLVRSLGKTHTVIVSSHILSEIEAMCDRIVIMKSGRLVYDQATHPVSEKQHTMIRISLSGVSGAFQPALRSLPSVRKVAQSGISAPGRTDALVSVSDPNAFGRELAVLASGLNLSILSLQPVERSLEDIFLSVSRGDFPQEGTA